jgi:ubiquinone/menaquinone biosynthesis C-methylase UbiE
MVAMDGAGGSSAADFYDGLAAVYDRLYPDWDLACREQGEALDVVLARAQGPGPHEILDSAVGIGTQLLGLAARGHTLVGTDISGAAVRRAREECARRGVEAPLGVADMRSLPVADRTFDAVVCADNAVAHLMTAAEVTNALRELSRVTRPSGHVLVTTRDYEQARRVHPPGTMPQVSAQDGAVTLSFQVWDWRQDGERYDLQHFQLVGDADAWQVTRRTAALFAITRDELTACAEGAGFAEVAWLVPEDSGFFQPLLLARVPG